MVSKAAKDLLRNTIRNTDYHNRLLEEEDMWRHWETEKGLTMMVTDDYLRRRMRMDEYAKPGQSCARVGGQGAGGGGGDSSQKNKVDVRELQKQKQAARVSQKSQSNFWMRKLMETEEKDPDRWGHSGYKELYPDEFRSSGSRRNRSHSSSASERLRSRRPEYKTARTGSSNKAAGQERWDHGGYRELYPDEFKSRRRQSSNERRSDSRRSESERSRSQRSRSPKVKTKKKHKHRSRKKSKKHKKRKRKSVPVITISDSSSRSSRTTDESDDSRQRSRSSGDHRRRDRPSRSSRQAPRDGNNTRRPTARGDRDDSRLSYGDSDSSSGDAFTPPERSRSLSQASSRSTVTSSDEAPPSLVSATSSSSPSSLITPTSSSLGSELSYNSTAHSNSNWVESDTSETQLETRRDYLKRKLEEVTAMASSNDEEDSYDDDDRSSRDSGERNRRVVIRRPDPKRRKESAPPAVPATRRRLESQVVRGNAATGQARSSRLTKR